MSSAKWRPFCLGLNVLETWRYVIWYFELTTPIARLYGQDMSIYTNIDGITVKPVYNDHIYNKTYYLWFIP